MALSERTTRSLTVAAIAAVMIGPRICVADLVLHVDQDAAPSGDGLSWPTAYRHLQDALQHASDAAEPVEVRVAEGVYRPDQDEAGRVQPGDRHASFHLSNEVEVLGGFAGVGAADPSERDIARYVTLLGGDLSQDDQLYFINVDDNAYHVVTARGTDATAVLDGVTVSGGNTFGLNGGELQEYLENGAGVFCWDGSPTLRRCTFRLNRAVRGGVIYANGETWYDGELLYVPVAPTLIDCLFTENYSVFYGGAVSLNVSGVTMVRCRFVWNETTGALGGGALSLRHAAIDGTEAVIHQCEFIGNFATAPSSGRGGALRILYVPTTIASSLFADNTADSDGGAIQIDPLTFSTTIANCTIAGNRALQGNGGGLRVTGFNVSIRNSVLWGNTHGGPLPLDECGQLCGPIETTVDASCVEGWAGQYTGEHVIATDPAFVDPDGPDNDPMTWDDNDYRLAAGSSCIDAADNALVPEDVLDLDGDGVTAEPIPFDLDGRPRLVDDPDTPDTGFGDPPVVDMGAYEVAVPQTSCPDAVRFDLPESNLAIFGVQFTADFLGPPEGVITGARADLTYETGGTLDAADLVIELQAPSAGVPTWTITGSDLGWSGAGTFSASIATDELNGVIDLGEPPPDFSLFLLVIRAEGFQPLAGHFTDSHFEVDVAPAGFVAGDVDGDGEVGVADLTAVILAWGPCPRAPAACPADLDCDGAVGVLDLLEVILGWST